MQGTMEPGKDSPKMIGGLSEGERASFGVESVVQ